MMLHTLRSRFVRLVDMHPLHRAPERFLCILRIRARLGATDGMIEDEDFRRTGAANPNP